MFTHSEYHADRPLPSGVSLSALISPPLADEPIGRSYSEKVGNQWHGSRNKPESAPIRFARECDD